jgi:hypothetical protein
MSPIFAWFDRLTTGRRLAALGAFVAALLGCENLLDFPLSGPFMVRVAGHPYLDMCAFCSGAQVLRLLDDFGEVGRRTQLLLMVSIDVAIPFSLGALGSMALAMLLRGRTSSWAAGVRLLPLLAMVLDFAENAGIVALVVGYPRRAEMLATLTGLLSGLKFCAYGAALVAVLALLIARLGRRRPVDG